MDQRLSFYIVFVGMILGFGYLILFLDWLGRRRDARRKTHK